jgi:hypothetical protein
MVLGRLFSIIILLNNIGHKICYEISADYD